MAGTRPVLLTIDLGTYFAMIQDQVKNTCQIHLKEITSFW